MANISDNSSTETTSHCAAASSDLLLFDLACLGFALPIILVLASLQRRTKFKLRLCDGRPGLLIPVNFLAGISYRYTIAATFGATASKCAQLFISIVINGDTIFDLGGDSWENIFQGLVGVLVYGIVFYPFFICLTTDYKLLGSVLGFLYGAPRFVFEISFLFRCSRSLGETGTSPFLYFIPELPTMGCVAFIVLRFAALLVLEVRRKFRSSFRESEEYQSILSTGETKVVHAIAEETDIVHVKGLLRHVGPKINQEDTRRWYTRLRYYIYKQRPDFKFSTQLISTMAVTAILIFQFLTTILINSQIFKKKFGAYENTLGDLVAVLYGSLQGGFIISALVSFTLFLHFLKCHREHFFHLCRGQRSFSNNVTSSPVNLVGKCLLFSGYQIAFAVWGFLILGIFLGFVFYILAIVIKYQKVLRDLLGVDLFKYLGQALVAFLPVVFLSLFVWIFQLFLAYVVFRDRKLSNKSIFIDNRRLFSIMSYFFFFLNILIGLFSCLARIIYGMILGVVFISRIDRTSLMAGYEAWDDGFVSYLGFLNVLVAHRHPVMLVFCELLITRHTDTKPDQPLEIYVSNTTEGRQECSYAKKLRYFTAHPREHRLPRLSQKAVNRWLLAVTLIHNPSLVKYRRYQHASSHIGTSGADNESIAVLVQ